MTRHSLRIVIVLGALITLLGGTGIFAVFSDRATTGPSDVTSGSLAKAADITIASAQPQDPMNSGPFICDQPQDDLTTPLFDFTASRGSLNEHFFCISNVGSSAVDLSLTAIDITDLDVGCTGDEAAFGDTTCGLDPNQPAGVEVPQAGELSPNLEVDTDVYDCMTGSGLLTPSAPDFSSTLAGLATTPETVLPATGLSNLAPGASICIRLRVGWSPVDATAAQVSQSDEATWKFAFDGTVPSN
jgi:hypothetical protein